RLKVNLDPATLNAMRSLKAYALVLARVHAVELGVHYPLTLTVADPDTGLERYFRVEFDPRFIEVETVGPVPPLTDDVLRRLRGAFLDPEFLRQVIPPESVVLRGFTVFRAVEVTEREVLSSLKRDLIDKESIVSNVRFEALQQTLRTLFRRPELRSPRPGDLDATHLPLLDEVLPLFSMAVQRSMEELNNRIQAVIKEKCTAIHPVVEWRFRKAVLKCIEQQAEAGAESGVVLEP